MKREPNVLDRAWEHRRRLKLWPYESAREYSGVQIEKAYLAGYRAAERDAKKRKGEL